jgi:hypothetical protein
MDSLFIWREKRRVPISALLLLLSHLPLLGTEFAMILKTVAGLNYLKFFLTENDDFMSQKLEYCSARQGRAVK